MGARYYHAIAHFGTCAAMRNAQNNADRRGKVAAYNIETLVRTCLYYRFISESVKMHDAKKAPQA